MTHPLCPILFSIRHRDAIKYSIELIYKFRVETSGYTKTRTTVPII